MQRVSRHEVALQFARETDAQVIHELEVAVPHQPRHVQHILLHVAFVGLGLQADHICGVTGQRDFAPDKRGGERDTDTVGLLTTVIVWFPIFTHRFCGVAVLHHGHLRIQPLHSERFSTHLETVRAGQ